MPKLKGLAIEASQASAHLPQAVRRSFTYRGRS